MAGIFSAGRVAHPKEDVFPTTGEHLDVRVIPQFGPQKGNPVNPRNARSIVQNVLIGDQRTPLVQPQGKGWKWNFPVTSEFGQRIAPTKDASTFHKGLDIGLAAGTPLAYRGYGTYRPDHGYGSIMTTDAQGNPYEIRLLHTKPGKASAVGPTVAPPPLALPGDQSQDVNVATETVNKSIRDALMGSLLEQAFLKRNEGASQANPYSQAFITQEMINEFA
jgi:hypothetical protein